MSFLKGPERSKWAKSEKHNDDSGENHVRDGLYEFFITVFYLFQTLKCIQIKSLKLYFL